MEVRNSIVNYNSEFWDDYTLKNKSKYVKEFSKFISDLTLSLKLESILEVGCNTGNDLKGFPPSFEAHGVDLNENAIKQAKQNLPTFKFQKASITKLPYDNSSMDLVFTHNLLNYINDDIIFQAMEELFRVSKKYLVNFEFFDEYEKEVKLENQIEYKCRNMAKRWASFNAKTISDVDMHEDIEPNKIRFTLIKKI